MPVLDVIVENLAGEDLMCSDEFLVDTGASVSVVGRKYEGLFKSQSIYDTISIQYGTGATKNLNIYECYFKIAKKKRILTHVAFDPELRTKPLLGNSGFIDKLKSLAIVSESKKVHYY